ncbi:MAG: sulfatase [Opitutales bacterium]|nr:sulfatase [Opitutales bacterium]
MKIAFNQIKMIACVSTMAKVLISLALGISSNILFAEKKVESPNILFISIDDLNDWIEPLGGHPNAITPNLNRLTKMGVSFERAYCSAPACNPSRVSIMTGIRPHKSGVYENNSIWRNSPALKNAKTLPQNFSENGYKVFGAGKIFHTNFPDPESWDHFWPSKKVQRPIPPLPPEGTSLNGMNTSHFDWGSVDFPVEEHSDWLVTDYIVDQLSKSHDKPFFLACGIYYPHLPWYLPQEYLDRFPLDSIQLPKTIPGDLDDLPEAAKENIRFKDHQNVIEHGEWKKAVQAYLASISFADECLGRVLDALKNGPHANNTYIVLWSDHGWNLGEKQHWRKFALWENTVRVPLIFAGPDLPQGETRGAPANLIDVYPTLLNLAGLEIPKTLDGDSLVPLIEDDTARLSAPSLTTWGKGNHSLRSDRWRYTRYSDGTEELYDHENDPHEWYNLADKTEHADLIQSFQKYLPTQEADPTPGEAYSPPFFERLEEKRQILISEGFYK